eukprot:SAG31_NODE_3350_length_4375_cov_1.732226_3_plen_72_part_00
MDPLRNLTKENNYLCTCRFLAACAATGRLPNRELYALRSARSGQSAYRSTIRSDTGKRNRANRSRLALGYW